MRKLSSRACTMFGLETKAGNSRSSTACAAGLSSSSPTGESILTGGAPDAAKANLVKDHTSNVRLNLGSGMMSWRLRPRGLAVMNQRVAQVLFHHRGRNPYPQ